MAEGKEPWMGDLPPPPPELADSEGGLPEAVELLPVRA